MAESIRPIVECEECNHSWKARTERILTRCPQCGSTKIVERGLWKLCIDCSYRWKWIHGYATVSEAYRNRPECPQCGGSSHITYRLESQMPKVFFHDLTAKAPDTKPASKQPEPSTASTIATPKEPTPSATPYKEPKTSTTFGTLGFGGFVAVVAVIALIGYCMANFSSGCDPYADNYADCAGDYEMGR